ncbi:site-specific integrase [Flavobacteriaceae bacterium]|nr:site-specific integrase [Flavobacteriaceae bacterium]
MHVNFYKKPQIKTHKTPLKVEKSVLFLDYLESYISNSATKRVQGYGTVGLAHNTIRTYKSLFRIVKGYEFEKSEKLYLNSIDKYTAEFFTRFLKIEQQYSDNYCGQLLKLLKIILRDAEKSGLEVHPYSNYIESFKQKSSDRILHILNPQEIKTLKGLKQVPSAYKDSYKWLLIGLCIGQRVSDLLKLSPDNLRKAPTGLYIDILQQKTKKAVTVGVADPLVIELLENEFPRRVSQVAFNKQIKALCRMAGIENLVSGLRTTQKQEGRKLYLLQSMNL